MYYDDARSHPPPGPRRSFRLPKVTLPGGGFISKGEDGRVAVAGRESLRILRIADPLSSRPTTKIESTRNLWDGSGLKIDCASTDVAWAYGVFNNKVLTSARNGELIMWDLAKTGHSKYERRTKEHLRSIHAMSVSSVIHHYCMTGSADADFRIWDLRDIQSSVMRVHNPSAVRRVIFSPCLWNPLFVLIGMDNGTLHRWDLKMGQRGLLDRLPVAHTAPITTIDWYSGDEQPAHAISFPNQQGTDHYTGNTLGWVASAGLDRCVKIWDLTGPEASTHMPNKPTYALHPSHPVRRVLWRPGYECELAVVSHADFTVSSHVDHLHPGSPVSGLSSGVPSRAGSSLHLDSVLKGLSDLRFTPKESKPVLDQSNPISDAVEVWDVRRSWLPKWSVSGTSVEGGVTDIEFADPYTLLGQNTNGTFTQLDMRDMSRPLDAISRTSATWTPDGGLAFVTDNSPHWEIPYDDVHPSRLNNDSTVKLPMKHLGDRPFHPKTQKLGVFASAESHFDAESFQKLANAYLIEGDDSPSLCTTNMQAALAVRKPHIAQVWMLMATSLTKHVPSPLPTPPQSPPPRVSSLNNLPRNTLTTPVSALASYSFPSNANSSRSPEVSRLPRGSPHVLNNFDRTSRLGGSNYRSPSTSRRPTPASSKSSSPLLLTTTLPSVTTTTTTTPTLVTPRRASFLSRRESIDSGISSTKQSAAAVLRRKSLSGPLLHHHSASPIEKNSTSIKLAGEGVLSDSDSSPDGQDEKTISGGDGESSDDFVPPLSGHVAPSSSPLLSRHAEHHSQQQQQHHRHHHHYQQQRHWTEEEEDETYSSPSPGSTDTDSDGEETSVFRKSATTSLSNKPKRSTSAGGTIRVVGGSRKSRSRSSTLASLLAPPKQETTVGMVTAPALGSQSSTGTVIAVGVAGGADSGGQGQISAIAELGAVKQSDEQQYRQQQQQVEKEPQVPATIRVEKVTTRRRDFVERHESIMLNSCWEMIKEAFEELITAGDVQTTATMAIIAPKELGISMTQRLHIFDAYIDQLSRCKLYTTAAYFRKRSQMQQIKNMTLLDTTIYTTCGRCHKPLSKPMGKRSLDEPRKLATFSFCPNCRSPAVTCTICRLPVRNMVFQCSICQHGGHQSCYREFYLGHPMVDIPAVSSDQHRGRSAARSTGSNQTSSLSPTRAQAGGELAGHPCAAGCGHYCWATLKPCR